MQNRTRPAATRPHPHAASWHGPPPFAVLLVSAALLLGACGGPARLGGPEALVGSYELVQVEGHELPYFEPDRYTRGCFDVIGAGGIAFAASGQGRLWFDEAYDCRPPAPLRGHDNPVQLEREEHAFGWRLRGGDTVVLSADGEEGLPVAYRLDGDMLRLTLGDDRAYQYRRR